MPLLTILQCNISRFARWGRRASIPKPGRHNVLRPPPNYSFLAVDCGRIVNSIDLVLSPSQLSP
jgi:hypothetical protein